MPGVFVTGTDTGVGKTVTCAALLYRYRTYSPVYWKPIQTGIEEDDDTATVEWLSGCAQDGVFDEGVRLLRPVSPHLAARLSGTKVTVDRLAAIRSPLDPATPLVVEGAGGVLVPLNGDELMVDLIARLALPVVLVARSGLGTINHTLLSLEALASRGLPVAGVVMVGERQRENREAIEHHGGVPVVGELPRFSPLTPEIVQSAATDLDPAGHLTRHLARPLETR